MKKTNEMYEAPFLEVAEVEVERGIATSTFKGVSIESIGGDEDGGDWEWEELL